MSKTLVLAEKPSVGREIARVLGCKQVTRNAIFGDKYIVTWALGHLIELSSPETYNERYKHWNLEDLPMLPDRLKLQIISRTSAQYKIVKDLLNRKDVINIVIATDAGREGELVGRWILEKAKCKKPIKRLWISSQTDKAIKEGFRNLKDGKGYENLYKSAVCRAESDWVMGLNVTRALTCKHNAQLSAGRVQTPTLNMIVMREAEIKNFKPVKYWTVSVNINGVKYTWEGNNQVSRFYDRVKLDSFLNKIKSTHGKVVSCITKEKRTPAPQAYDLTTLQIDANNKFGFGAKKTLSVLQGLYEHHKIVSYPRTDSKYITEDIVKTLDERLVAVSSSSAYRKEVAKIRRNTPNINKRFVDNAKVSDHHALIPTEATVFIHDLSNEERKIYDLIIMRFLSVISYDYKYKEEKVTIEIGGELFTSKFETPVRAGWKAVYEDITIEEVKGQSYKKDETVLIKKIQEKEDQTKPPARYTEATLLKDMEDPRKFVQDKNMKVTLTVTGGIGTVATRADIIEKLYKTFYIEERNKHLHPTSKGKQLIEIVPADLKSPLLTAKWESRLNSIAKGEESPITFISEIKNYTKKLVESVVTNAVTYKHDNITKEKCPECGKFLLKVKTKKGEMIVCQDRECGYRKSTSIESNARCPKCHVKLFLFGDGENKMFKCKKCGYKEKLTSWNKRKEDEGTKMNKNETRKYLDKMKKKESEENFNNPFAKLLKDYNK